MKKLLLLASLFVLSGIGHAACTGASPTWTATIDQTSVTTCISNATSGDTVNVSSGTATWTNVSISSSKAIVLVCPTGPCNVTISGGFTMTANASISTQVSGFTFTASSSINITGSITTPYPTMMRFYNNTVSGGNIMVVITGVGPVVLLDHNSISTTSNAAETFHINGNTSSSSSTTWTLDVVPGSANMSFIENNTWSISSPGSNYCQGEEADYGAVFVMRDNQFTGCQIDVHGGLGNGGGRWIEFYDNQFFTCCASSSAFDWRAGSGVFFGNTGTSWRSGTYIKLGPEGSDPTGSYPVPFQFGQGIDPNGSSGTPSCGTAGTCNYNPNYIWGNDSELQNNQNVTNSSMVALGSSPTACTGSSLGSNTCNAVLTSTQPATLLRCQTAADVTAGCPVSYTYSPYTYPHPLDNCQSNQFGSGATCGSTLAPPTNIQVIQKPGNLAGLLWYVLPELRSWNIPVGF